MSRAELNPLRVKRVTPEMGKLLAERVSARGQDELLASLTYHRCPPLVIPAKYAQPSTKKSGTTTGEFFAFQRSISSNSVEMSMGRKNTVNPPPPSQQPHSWWTTIPGLITAVTGLIVAIGGFLTVLHATGVLDDLRSLYRPKPDFVVKEDAPRPPHPAPLDVGWIYVGTRVAGEWKTTVEENHEPPLTLSTSEIPQTGIAYRTTATVWLRENAPVPDGPGVRPTMTKGIKAIQRGSQVKVDQIREYPLSAPSRSWIFAHITVLPGG